MSDDYSMDAYRYMLCHMDQVERRRLLLGYWIDDDPLKAKVAEVCERASTYDGKVDNSMKWDFFKSLIKDD